MPMTWSGNMRGQQSMLDFTSAMEKAGLLVRIKDEKRVDELPLLMEQYPKQGVLVERVKDSRILLPEQCLCDAVRGDSCAVSMGASCCDDDYQLSDEKNEADGEHSHADGCGPGEFEVGAPIENYECDTAEEQDGAGPATETCGDFALAFVLGAANFADGLDGEALMVVDAAAQGGDECDLLGCVFFRFRESAEDDAVGGICGWAVLMI
jgi:hypothetical protein